MDNETQGTRAIRALIDGSLRSASGTRTNTLLVAGPPCTGKTGFALQALMAGLHAFGDTRAVMTVSNRKTADRYADEVIRQLQASSQARPVTTLSAVAFRVIAAMRAREGALPPKLLNGAEQDTLVRRVMSVHVRHAVAGDECATCALLREYFALDDWAGMVTDLAASPDRADGPAGMRADADADAEATAPSAPAAAAGRATTESLFLRGINDAFVVQLRDMLARMDELGASYGREPEILDRLGPWSPHTERLRVQWRLAFALRREYADMVGMAYPGEFRLDSSRLLVEGTDMAAHALPSELPRYLVVDDFQDLTLAGLAFLQALSEQGATLVLVGDPDEAVQTFRGSYPEYLYAKVGQPPFSAYAMRLRPDSQDDQSGTSEDSAGLGRGETPAAKPDSETMANAPAPDYRSLVASRISLSILSPEDDATAPSRRAWKLPRYLGSLPIAALPAAGDAAAHAALATDGSVHAALYRSANEELDDVIWQVKEARLSQGRQWNDLALIAHDNVTVRAFGERLRRDGVPVRYSSVTRPLKDEPFVQGLFALIELARLRRRLLRKKAELGLARAVVGAIGECADASREVADDPDIPAGASRAPSFGALAGYVRTRVAALMDSPLISVGSQTQGEGLPARLAPVESAMQVLGSLHLVLRRDRADTGDEPPAPQEVSSLAGLERAWSRLRDSVLSGRKLRGHDAIQVDDQAFAASAADEATMELDAAALYVMLAYDGFEDLTADGIVEVIRSVGGHEPNAEAFGRLWDLVAQVAEGLSTLPSDEPQYALSLAWDSCKVAERWQREALNNTDDGRTANDRLDAAMRLFDYAAGSGASRDITGFLEQVRSMRIEADSLAKVAPVDQAVTVTTPAGADGQHWAEVWIVAMQEGVWPNLAARNTMFGGEELAQIMLRGQLADDRQIALTGHDPQLAAVLCGEQKSFLTALTRGRQRVRLSAVANDDLSPSDFLYGYLPELFDRRSSADPAARPYREVGGSGDFAGLDADPRGLVASARMLLAKQALKLRHIPGRQRNDDGGAANAHAATATAAATVCEEPLRMTLRDPASTDASEALALLACNGIASADPDNWAYPQRQDEPAAAGDGIPVRVAGPVRASAPSHDEHQTSQTDTDGSVVSLYPSAVDGLWACPVCWLLENRFAGPQQGSAATAFGTVIHAVAQQASENGLDRPDFLPGLAAHERITAISERMMSMYLELRDDLQAAGDPASRYNAIRKNDSAHDVLETIARYFVTSNEKEYLGGNTGRISIGTVANVTCERSFAAEFSLDDVLEAYNAVRGIDPISRRDLYGIMGALVGGWPEAMRENLKVRLSGRIDREETRRMPDGSTAIRLLDYKTGAVPGVAQQFSDLQLVCYQLGLAFPTGDQSDGQSRGSAPRIAQCDLFYVAKGKMPAESYAPESLFQPPLFVDGHLNDMPLTARYHYTDLHKLTDTVPLDGDAAPDDVGGGAWRGFVALRGTQAVWALTMIARVFYAAAASRSSILIAHPSASHMQHCRMRAACPACSGSSDTVFEIRKEAGVHG
ncbi:PD-(D/E)XK nuclease family protein [Bifidobacterium sp.]|uniref:PD-(D/E)XK nuclease family protein n=1 Tax=Bifidobacterium sp. TaxID=41200 RepID=UPI0025BD02E0|nr:PD-(D/E)XK nuclease family protein [Bifidobacterium sp.]MCH4208836.1 PD-(D/E)XK nuclease family protein [Bifidobacterium sp.]MCI1225372.1 PD-(D/E)XK nuclease family protein [Bifidobacterium sp.]